MEIEQHIWGMTSEGEAIILYILRNAAGAEVWLSTYGAGVISVKVPDRTGHIDDVLLGYKRFEGYFGDPASCGKSLGRCAGRIAYGELKIEGQDHRLEINNGPDHSNGGTKGFGNRLWDARVEKNRVVMDLHSDDGDQGYPGELYVEAIFDFDDQGTLAITYLARTEQTTAVNLASNLYFNLSGEASNDVLDHELRLHCNHYLETDERHIPTGLRLDVTETPLDFRTFHTLRDGIDSEACRIREFRGYDHLLLINGWQPNILTEAGELRDPRSGRRVTIATSQPCIAIDTGNRLAGGCPEAKSGGRYADHAGIALGPRNQIDGSPPLLQPGELYCQKTAYHFGIYE